MLSPPLQKLTTSTKSVAGYLKAKLRPNTSSIGTSDPAPFESVENERHFDTVHDSRVEVETSDEDLPSSIPLLAEDGVSKGAPLYGDGGLTEKDFDPDALLERPPPRPQRSVRGFTYKFLGWPAAVILWQTSLQLLAWGFFIVVKIRGQIALPFGLALWVKNNGHLVTLSVTLIATVLAGLSSFLFSYAIRRSMSLYLYRPVSIATLGASVSISMRSIIFHRRSWKWPAVSLVFFILTGVQTSSWSTLLTPVTIIVSTPLVGSEIDLSSPILHQMWSDGSDTLQFCWNVTTSNPTAYASVPESAYAAASAVMGQESTTMVMNQAFNVSTSGILPVLLNSFDVSAWIDSSAIPATAHTMWSPPGAFSSNYSLDQQGFTMDVSCSFQNLTNSTTPSLVTAVDTVQSWGDNLDVQDAFNITYSQMASTCDAPLGDFAEMGGNWTAAFTKPESDYVMLITCKPDNYTAIFAFSGKYSWLPMTVCSVAPKVTRVHANYATLINATVDYSGAQIQDPESPTAYTAMSNLFNAVTWSQSIENNELGDHFTAMGERLSTSDSFQLEDVLKVLEAYIWGSAEYSASMFRTCLMANTTFDDRVPENITVPLHGTLHTETLGWAYVGRTTGWVLIPGTLLTLATIAVVSAALYRHVGDLPGDSHHRFDPSNPLHLMAAAAAGGLNNSFRGLSGKDMEEGERLNVVLGSIPGRGPALVRADQYRPVFVDAFSPRSAHDDAE
ncbi:hypothetical protein DFH06DRAFT_723330 [Mycena polygramma]|nr:hypothetical protein DFH06DRAFT_723330 [Mycena polygramma]